MDHGIPAYEDGVLWVVPASAEEEVPDGISPVALATYKPETVDRSPATRVECPEGLEAPAVGDGLAGIGEIARGADSVKMMVLGCPSAALRNEISIACRF